MKRIVSFAAVTLLLGTLVNPTSAATITVGSGGDYADLQTAIAEHTAGNWGDGNDVISLASEVFTLADEIVPIPQNEGSLTLEAQSFSDDPAQNPIIAMDPAGVASFHMFFCDSAGTVVFDGLTIIGPDGTASGNAKAGIRVGDPGADKTLDVIARRCVLTANAGGNAPKTDWGSDSAQPTNGTIGYPLFSSAALAGEANLTVEDCTVAYTAVDGGIAKSGIATTGASTWLFQGTLFINGQEKLARLRDVEAPSSNTFRDCAIINSPSSAITLQRNDLPAQSLTGPLTVEDTIIDVAGGGMVLAFDMADTTLTFNRVTFKRHPGADDCVLVFNPGTGVNVFIHDVVTSGQDSVLRVRPDDDPPATVASLDIENIAAHNMNAYRASQHADIKAAFDNLYGGAGPLTDDPMWLSGDGSGYEVLDGVIGWDRGTNELYDVDNPAYTDMGTPGFRAGALTGGADPTSQVPVELTQFSLE